VPTQALGHHATTALRKPSLATASVCEQTQGAFVKPNNRGPAWIMPYAAMTGRPVVERARMTFEGRTRSMGRR